MQLVTLQLGGWFLPAALRWLALLGPLLRIAGVVRLERYLATGHGVGSLLGQALRLLL